NFHPNTIQCPLNISLYVVLHNPVLHLSKKQKSSGMLRSIPNSIMWTLPDGLPNPLTPQFIPVQSVEFSNANMNIWTWLHTNKSLSQSIAVRSKIRYQRLCCEIGLF